MRILWQIDSSNYDVGAPQKLFCGWTPGPSGWAAINGQSSLPPSSRRISFLNLLSLLSGYGPNWTHAVGQFKVYSDWPLVCTYKYVLCIQRASSVVLTQPCSTHYFCSKIQFWVR